MKISKTHHKTKQGIIKKNPKREEWIVFNYTDGITAWHSTFPSKEVAEEFIKAFRQRFTQQGYYRNSRGQAIPIADVDVRAIKVSELGEAVRESIRMR